MEWNPRLSIFSKFPSDVSVGLKSTFRELLDFRLASSF